MSFKSRVRKRSIIIAIIPLILACAFFMKLRVDDLHDEIKKDLKETSYVVANTPLVQKTLAERKNDFEIQNYVKKFADKFKNVDIIVVGDMTGQKYSHLDVSQIGHKYVNTDNRDVIKYGTSYYSTMQGSMGVTVRYFDPIYYKDKQVGFVMVGKYLKDVESVTNKVIFITICLFILILPITILLSETFARKIKKEMLGMEPDEIARLYNEKKIILDSIDEGVIAIDTNNKILEINDNCFKMFDTLNIEELIEKLSNFIDKKKSIEMKEITLSGEKVFVNLSFIKEKGKYLGAVITLMKSENINRLAREITGIDGLLKNIRANVHEFKNKLHVILGLINLEEYNEAKKYISDCQKEVLENTTNVAKIKDNLISAMLLSKKLIANEKNIEFIINDDSYMMSSHGRVTSIDIITILGNLIENAFDACVEKEGSGIVEVYIYEDDKAINIEVKDNGKNIKKNIKDSLFENGVTSKGEGRGIGLSTVKGRIDLYGGSIKINENKKNKKFIINILKEG